jgi:hypothetical protein
VGCNGLRDQRHNVIAAPPEIFLQLRRIRRPNAVEPRRALVAAVSRRGTAPSSSSTSPLRRAGRWHSGGYVVKGAHQVGFKVGAFDSSQPLLVDPVLSYATYLGGSGDDFADVGAVDVAANTNSVNFPTALGAYQNTVGGGFDAFVAKLSPSGSGLGHKHLKTTAR